MGHQTKSVSAADWEPQSKTPLECGKQTYLYFAYAYILLQCHEFVVFLLVLTSL